MLQRRGDPAEDGQGVNAFVVTVDVPECQAFLDRAVSAGGTVAVPRGAIAGVGWNAYFKDPDGNHVGIIQSDPDVSYPARVDRRGESGLSRLPHKIPTRN